MPSARAQARPDGRLPQQVNHWNTRRRIIRASWLLRQGRGGRHFACAFARFRMEAWYEGILHLLLIALAELPTVLPLPLRRSKGLSNTSGNRWQIILLISRATLRQLL